MTTRFITLPCFRNYFTKLTDDTKQQILDNKKEIDKMYNVQPEHIVVIITFDLHCIC